MDSFAIKCIANTYILYTSYNHILSRIISNKFKLRFLSVQSNDQPAAGKRCQQHEGVMMIAEEERFYPEMLNIYISVIYDILIKDPFFANCFFRIEDYNGGETQ